MILVSTQTEMAQLAQMLIARYVAQNSVGNKCCGDLFIHTKNSDSISFSGTGGPDSPLMAVASEMGLGTVTSVGLSDITGFAVASGAPANPITSSGTLGYTLSNQNANLIFAGPATGAAAKPTFRAIVTADIESAIAITANVTPILSGTDKRVLFDDNAVIGEHIGFTYDKTTSSVTLGGSLLLPNSASAVSAIYLNNVRYLTNFGSSNFTDVYLGPNAGPAIVSTISQNMVGIGLGVLNAWNPVTVGANQQVVAIGWQAMGNAIGGSNSVAIGSQALLNQHEGTSSNIAIGKVSLFSCTTGDSNVAVGANTNITSGQYNTFIGHEVSQNGTTAMTCTGIGYRSIFSLTTGQGNTAIGQRSFELMSTGTDNTGLGTYSGNGISTGNNNLFLGSWSGAYLPNTSNYGVIQTGNQGGIGIATVIFDFGNKRMGINILQGSTLNHTLEVNGDIRSGVAGSTQGKLIIEGATSGVITIQTAAAAGTYTLTLPITAGTANYFLQTDGTGILTWAAGGGSSAITIGTTSITSGTDTRVLFDDGGKVGESAGFTFNKTSKILIINSINIGTGNVSTELTNTAIGNGAGNAITTATSGTWIGYHAGIVHTTGAQTTAIGYNALSSNTTGDYNTAIGSSALQSNVSGSNNVAIGIQALLTNTGSSSVAVGYAALQVASSGGQNTGLGFQALLGTTTGGTNTGVGYNAGASNTTGANNTYLGYAATGNTTQSNNTVIGAQVNIGGVANNIAIGNGTGAIKAQHDNNKWTLVTQVYINAPTTDANAALNIQGINGAGNYDGIAIYPFSLATKITYGAAGIQRAGSFDINTSSGSISLSPSVGVYIGTAFTAATARLHIKGGTATASTAPLKLTSGTSLTTAEAGAMEYNGTDLFFTKSGTTRGCVIVATVVTTETVISDTTLTITYNGTTYKILARA